MYQCTQDLDDIMNRSETSLSAPLHTDSGYVSGAESPREPRKTELKPWMEQAVKEGKYTLEQEATLRAQRQKVLETITQSESRFEAQLESIPISLDQITKSKGDVSTSDVPPPKIRSIQKTKPRLFPYCIQRACQLCRPTFKDRVWQRFENVLTDDAPVDVSFETDQRPLSDPKFVRHLGLRKPLFARSPVLKTYGSMENLSLDDLGQIVHGNDTKERRTHSQEGLQHSTPASAEADSTGFRNSVKRSFKRMLMSRRNTFYDMPPGGTPPMKTKSDLSMTLMNDSADFDISLWRQLNEEVLSEASATHLPGQDGYDGLEVEPGLEAEEAIALTEEAADLGTADIIVAV